MIPLLRRADPSEGRFHAVHLPVEVQDAVLRFLVAPRVASSSMAPTLVPGDTLELEPADELHIGDVLVFRHHDGYVCHRLVGVRGDTLSMKGDASTGEPETVDRSQVVGRVSAIARAVTAPSEAGPNPRSERLVSGLQALLSRGILNRTIRRAARCLSRPVPGAVFRRLTRRWITVDILEATPLRCTESFAHRLTVRLNQPERLLEALASYDDWKSIRLILRLGPISLAACRLSPWGLWIRSAARCLRLEEALAPVARALKNDALRAKKL